MTRFGQNLRALRERAGLTQEELAARLQYKGQAPLSLLETGAKIPTPKTIIKLAHALDCTSADLLVGVVTPYDELRGSTAPTAAPREELRLSERERGVVKNLRKLREDEQAHLAGVIAAVAKYRPARNPPGTPGRSRESKPRPLPGPPRGTSEGQRPRRKR